MRTINEDRHLMFAAGLFDGQIDEIKVKEWAGRFIPLWVIAKAYSVDLIENINANFESTAAIIDNWCNNKKSTWKETILECKQG